MNWIRAAFVFHNSRVRMYLISFQQRKRFYEFAKRLHTEYCVSGEGIAM